MIIHTTKEQRKTIFAEFDVSIKKHYEQYKDEFEKLGYTSLKGCYTSHTVNETDHDISNDVSVVFGYDCPNLIVLLFQTIFENLLLKHGLKYS
jgi:hypothetical protein